MPKLVLRFGAAVIKEIPLGAEFTALTVGRKPDNDVVIDNPAVSGHHLKIVKESNKFFVEDLNSTNGSFLNGQKVLKAELHNSDQIAISSHKLVFVNIEEQLPVPGAQAGISSEETVVLDPSKQKELLEKMAAVAKETTLVGGPKTERVGMLRIVDGAIDLSEIELTKYVTYIGGGKQCDVKIKAGLFASSDVVAAISRRPDGYLFKAVKENFAKINNNTVTQDQSLKDGDVIEAGKTKMFFLTKDKK